ncbi:MAG: zinc ribbon domain-containing protein [Candidatus Bathyarchaeota archaeon]|nr:MAG: zinc ribbon domain-containing protein [Candidatus Bathyarchaeota archaeon]
MSRVANILHSVTVYAKQVVRTRLYCPYCGTRNRSKATHCRKCGKPLPSGQSGFLI